MKDLEEMKKYRIKEEISVIKQELKILTNELYKQMKGYGKYD